MTNKHLVEDIMWNFCSHFLVLFKVIFSQETDFFVNASNINTGIIKYKYKWINEYIMQKITKSKYFEC